MSFLKNVGSAAARVKHSALVAIGQSEATTDPEFDSLALQFRDAYSSMKQLGKHIVGYQNGIKDIGVSSVGMGPMIVEQYDGNDRMFQIANQYKDHVGPHIVELGKSMEVNLAEDFHRPLTQYLGQYKTIEERIEERTTRLKDMDRFLDEYKTLQSKPDADPARVQIAKEKYEYKARAYQELNDELKRDIPKLLSGKTTFMDALFATFVQAQIQFLQNTAGTLQSFSPHFDGVNRNSADQWEFVITDASQSAINPEIAAKGAKPMSKSIPLNKAPPTASQGLPPRPAPAQPPQVRARALYPFVGQDASELSLQPNDIIVVTRQGGEWWEGEINGRRGLFPSNYVQLM